jgi:hypothetical protein
MLRLPRVAGRFVTQFLGRVMGVIRVCHGAAVVAWVHGLSAGELDTSIALLAPGLKIEIG